MKFIYLHGFASSPDSKKAAAFKKAFRRNSLPLIVPDLQEGNFEGLTLSSQIEVVQKILDQCEGDRIGLIGSSMGGYLAALLAQLREEVAGLYLMAPGFKFLERWKKKLLENNSDSSQIPDLIEVYHYGYTRNVAFNTRIFKDSEVWETISLDRKIPIRIVHGLHDESVDIGVSRDFAGSRPWSQLVELDSDHSLISHIDWIVKDCLEFFEKMGLINFQL